VSAVLAPPADVTEAAGLLGWLGVEGWPGGAGISDPVQKLRDVFDGHQAGGDTGDAPEVRDALRDVKSALKRAGNGGTE
jgi:hypothetical protein